MPRIGTIDLTEGTADACGAAFHTLAPIGQAFDRHTRRGSVRAEANGRWVVVRLASGSGDSDIRSNALAFAEETLDIVFARHELLVVLDSPMHDNVVWWCQQEGLQVLATHIAQFNAPRLPVRVLTDRSEERPRKPTAWHTFLRFMRMAYCTSDYIERFRYLYLAVENAASMLLTFDRAIHRSESNWLKLVMRGLQCDWGKVLGKPLSPLLDPVDVIVEKLYRGTRLPTFHAKADGRDVLLPADVNASIAAAEAAALCHRVLQVLSNELEYPISQSGFYSGGFHMLMDKGSELATIHISAMTEPFDAADVPFIGDETHPSIILECSPGPKKSFVWTRTASIVNPHAPFGRVGLVNGDAALTAFGYDALVDPHGVQRLSFVVGGQMSQRGVSI